MSESDAVKDLIKIPDAAVRLEHHENTVRRWAKRYPGVSVKIGHTYHIYGTTVDKLMTGVPLEEL